MKLLLVDGHSLAYRAFFAMPALSNSKGEPTQAVLGVANMIFKILKDENPSHMMVFFDRGIPAFRLDAYPDYKATRLKPPDDFVSQLPLIKEFFKAIGVQVVEEPGYEADDWIAAAVKQVRDLALPAEIVILSGDLDLLQLVSDKTTVLVSKKGISQLIRYTVEEVQKRFSLQPFQLVDLKALAGDPSDNIQGVKGLGEKTAAQLLSEWGSAEALISNLERLPAKTKTLLHSSMEEIRRNKDLVTLRQDAPLTFKPESCRLHPFDAKLLQEFLERLEFNALLKRLGLQSSMTTSYADYIRVDSETLFSEVFQEFQKAKQAALLFWPSPSPFLSEHFLVLEVPEVGRWVFPPPYAIAGIKELFNYSGSKELFVYDWKGVELVILGKQLPPPSWEIQDILIMGWLCNTERTNPSIPQLAREYLNITLPLFNGTEIAGVLATWSSVLCKLGLELKVKVQALGLEALYKTMEFPVAKVLAKMEWEGMAVDQPYLDGLAVEFNGELRALEEAVYRDAGQVFNINSSKQLANVLYEKLGLSKGRKTKTGYSTDVEELERLALDVPLAGKLLQYREIAKLLNTYVETLPKMINPCSGRLHTTYLQTGTATGRISSKEPNLQNIPIRTPYGKKIRKAFVPGKPGWKILSADYSQIELRVLAHFSKDPVLLEAFHHHEDVHACTASLIFNVPASEITPEMRRMAKVVNFGILYGITEHGLSQNLKIKKEEAREYIKRYFERFPRVEAYLKGLLEEARTSGVTRTLFGRLRYVPELLSQNSYVRQQAERIAMNSPLQGTAADLIKIAMIRVKEKLENGSLHASMVTQVHDELVFEVQESDLEALAGMVKEEMEHVSSFEFPLLVDLSFGENWAETMPLLDGKIT